MAAAVLSPSSARACGVLGCLECLFELLEFWVGEFAEVGAFAAVVAFGEDREGVA
jgi:hypothetical protein